MYADCVRVRVSACGAASIEVLKKLSNCDAKGIIIARCCADDDDGVGVAVCGMGLCACVP